MSVLEEFESNHMTWNTNMILLQIDCNEKKELFWIDVIQFHSGPNYGAIIIINIKKEEEEKQQQQFLLNNSTLDLITVSGATNQKN